MQGQNLSTLAKSSLFVGAALFLVGSSIGTLSLFVANLVLPDDENHKHIRTKRWPLQKRKVEKDFRGVPTDYLLDWFVAGWRERR